jgi:hypothetical protein
VSTTGDTAPIKHHSSSCHTSVNMGASIFFTAAMIRTCEVRWHWWDVLERPTFVTWPRWLKGTDYWNSEEYRYTHVDACVADNLNIVSMCAVSPLVHTSNISSCQNTFFSLPKAVNSSIKVGPLVFLLYNICNHREHYETSCIKGSTSVCNILPHCTKQIYLKDAAVIVIISYQLNINIAY